MGYEEFGKLIESGNAEAVAKVFNAMEGQAQDLMLQMLTDKQLDMFVSMFADTPQLVHKDIDSYNDTGDVTTDDAAATWINNDEFDEDPDFYVNRILSAIDDDDVEAVGGIFLSLNPEQQASVTKNFTSEQGEKLADMLNMYNDIYQKDYDDIIDEMYAKHDAATDSEESSTDANGDGDTDIITADTNGNGKPDTAVVAGDDAKEEKEAVKAAKEDLGLDGDDDTSTGKKKKELEDDNADVLSDKKQKDTCSDSRQKNIISALSELRF